MVEIPGAETAFERFRRKSDDGTYDAQGHYDWEAFCSVPDYCCRPCVECGAEGNAAREASKAPRLPTR